jgi:hypothetical protein
MMDAATTARSLAASAKSTKMNWGSTQDFFDTVQTSFVVQSECVWISALQQNNTLTATSFLHHKQLIVLARATRANILTRIFTIRNSSLQTWPSVYLVPGKYLV